MKVLVVGKTGQLGRELEDYDWSGPFRLVHLSRSECDLADPVSIQTAVLAAQPGIVVNAAAYTAVDRAESEPDVAMRVNGEGPAVLARCCTGIGAALVHVSTDYVFDGTKEGAYREDDHVNPLSVYGRSKLAGEEAVRKLCPRHAIVRTSWVFSRHGNNFVKTMLRLGAQRDELGVVKDQTGAPTSARDIAHAIATIVGAIAAGAGEWGTFHFASAEPTSWFGFAQAIFAAARPQKSIKVLPITSEQFGAPARRPANSVLDCTRIHEAFGIERPSWDAALEETLAELAREGAPVVTTPANMPRVVRLGVPDVLLIRPVRHSDSRGYFSEAFNEAAWHAAGVHCRFIQDNQSLSVQKGTLRGLHFQIPPFAQAKLVRVLKGSIFDVAIDIRKGSPAYGKFAAATLSAENGEQLFVPAGFAHGFCTLEPDTEVLYKIDAPYSREHERGLAWDDPAIAIPWPVAGSDIKVLDRDRQFPRLDGLGAFF